MNQQELRTATSLENACRDVSRHLNKIDWEQRRYEIASQLYIGGLNNADGECRRSCFARREDYAIVSIELADILIDELKKRGSV